MFKNYFLYYENFIKDIGILFKCGYDIFCVDFLYILSFMFYRLFILIFWILINFEIINL